MFDVAYVILAIKDGYDVRYKFGLSLGLTLRCSLRS